MGLIVDKSAWNKLKKNFLQADSFEARVGWFPEDRYGSENDNLQMAQVAKWNEEGHNNGAGSLVPDAETPPRPFMRVSFRNALKAGSNDREFRQIVQAVVEGKSVMQPLKSSGRAFENTLRKVMIDFDNPGNAALTIEMKGFDDPLINSSQLVANVNSKVAKKGAD